MKKSMNVLFIGGMFPKHFEKSIIENSKGVVHYAANKFQWNLIAGLTNQSNLTLSGISTPFVGSYPSEYKKIIYKTEKKSDENYKMSNIEYFSFLNLWGIRSIAREIALAKRVKNFSKEESKNKVIIVYSPHTPFLKLAVDAKKKNPFIHLCLVVPDLPQYMNLNSKQAFYYKKLKSIDIQVLNKLIKFVDSFVLLTEEMKDVLKVGERPYVVIEGIVNSQEANKHLTINSSEIPRTIVYTGTLNKKFGVINLVKAFSNIQDKNINLLICGTGDAEEEIKRYLQSDSRIKLLGQLSNDEALILQRNATVLVNPRQNNEEFTKYSFPSKNMEYLLSGKPVISYRLDGIPAEYNNYLLYVEDDSIESLTNKIEEVLALSEEEKMRIGESGKKFILDNKNEKKVGEKIVDMIQKNGGC